MNALLQQPEVVPKTLTSLPQAIKMKPVPSAYTSTVKNLLEPKNHIVSLNKLARKSNLIKLGDAINQIFKDEKLDVKISQFSVKNNWKDIAGEPIANNTTEIFFNNKIIFITLRSDALKHEVSFRKEILLQNINKYCGYKLVEQIVIR